MLTISIQVANVQKWFVTAVVYNSYGDDDVVKMQGGKYWLLLELLGILVFPQARVSQNFEMSVNSSKLSNFFDVI